MLFDKTSLKDDHQFEILGMMALRGLVRGNHE
jgi:hypothetical protein